MAMFLVLTHFTEQGLQNVKDTTKRAEALRDMAKRVGATVHETYWTIGRYDSVAIVEAPNDEAMTALSISVGRLGNVHTETLRAFTRTEMDAILGKIA